MTAAHEQIHLKFSYLAAECQEACWIAGSAPSAGMMESRLQKEIEELGEEANKACYWL